MQHVHISGLSALITVLEVIVVIGSLNLLAQKYPNAPLARTWLSVMNYAPTN